MKLIKLALTSCVLGLSGAAALGACNWGSPIFAPASSCLSAMCGIGCTVTGYDANQYICYTNMDACCQCPYYTIHCDCTFGPGTGQNATRYNLSVYNCAGDGQTCEPN